MGRTTHQLFPLHSVHTSSISIAREKCGKCNNLCVFQIKGAQKVLLQLLNLDCFNWKCAPTSEMCDTPKTGRDFMIQGGEVVNYKKNVMFPVTNIFTAIGKIPHISQNIPIGRLHIKMQNFNRFFNMVKAGKCPEQNPQGHVNRNTLVA